MDPSRRAELDARLRECGEQEMLDILSTYIEEVDARVVHSALRNPHLSARVIEVLLSERRLLSNYLVQKALAEHPKTPERRVMNLIPALYWRDLVDLGGDSRVRPRVRQAADRRLSQRLPQLAIGERVAIARKAGPGVIARLLEDADLRVVGALLENPRLTEGLLAPLLNSDRARSEVLSRIARDRKWGARYLVKVAIARNPRTSISTAMELLTMLKKPDLKAIYQDPRLAEPVRRRAGLLFGVDSGG